MSGTRRQKERCRRPSASALVEKRVVWRGMSRGGDGKLHAATMPETFALD
jgi:hypothetical protein